MVDKQELTGDTRTRQTDRRLGKCLIVVAHFPPVGGGGVIRIVNFARNLSSAGWQVTVLAPEPSWMLELGGWPSDETLYQQLLADGVRLVHAPFKGRNLRLRRATVSRPTEMGFRAKLQRKASSIALSIAERISAWLRRRFFIDEYAGWQFAALLRALQLRASGFRPDLVVATSPPHSIQVIGRRVARLLRAPFVGDLRDQWSGNPHPAIGGKERVNRRLEDRVVRDACAMTVTTRESADCLRAVMGERAGDIEVVPNGFDGAAWEHVSDPMDERLVLTYAGTLGYPRDPESMAKAIDRVAQANPGFLDAFVLRLVGPVTPDAERRLREACGDRLETVGMVSQEESLRYMARSRWLLVILYPGEGAETAIPGKVYEYLAARRPVLALVGPGATERLLHDIGVALVASPDDTDAIAAHLEAMYEEWRSDDFGSLVALPDASTIAQYDRRRSVREFERILERCARLRKTEGEGRQ